VLPRENSFQLQIESRAIKTAVNMANAEDIVLIAGKGHEKYQEIDGVKYHFDDKEVLMEMFELLGK
jgi:UDP-N-acetylmuramoyl-L-alanyl-D-glutamate--2,6-diaminopimelate ligase